MKVDFPPLYRRIYFNQNSKLFGFFEIQEIRLILIFNLVSDSEYKLRYNTQTNLNKKLEEQIDWYEEEVSKMKDKIKQGVSLLLGYFLLLVIICIIFNVHYKL